MAGVTVTGVDAMLEKEELGLLTSRTLEITCDKATGLFTVRDRAGKKGTGKSAKLAIEAWRGRPA